MGYEINEWSMLRRNTLSVFNPLPYDKILDLKAIENGTFDTS